MWVRLTLPGYRAVRKVCAADTILMDALERTTITDKKRINVQAPYAAWHTVSANLKNFVFGPNGGRRANSDTYFNALRAVVRGLNNIDRHPALSGLAMMEWHTDIIPAWRIVPDGDRAYSPYPHPGNLFVVLTPDWRRVGDNIKVTIWHPEDSGEGLLAQEETHLALWRGPIT